MLCYLLFLSSVFSETHADADRERDENGVMRCFSIFDIHARAGQAVKLGEELPEQIYTPMYDEQLEVESPVFASEKEDPKTTYDGLQIGKWTIRIPDKSLGRKREFGVSFIFGGTEVAVKVVDKATGKIEIIRINCLD